MIACDYCDEGLPLWHRREPDEFGLEVAQFMPCELVLEMQAVELCSRMIEAGMSRLDVQLVANLAKARQ
jgi:hypothetical protein